MPMLKAPYEVAQPALHATTDQGKPYVEGWRISAQPYPDLSAGWGNRFRNSYDLTKLRHIASLGSPEAQTPKP